MTKDDKISNSTGIFLLALGRLFLGIQIIALPGLLPAQLKLEALDLLDMATLAGETHHVQGIEVDGSQLWVTAVDRKTKRGFVFLYQMAGKESRQAMEVQQGSRYHPGGISPDGNSLWVPVAEYVPNSTTTIQKRNKKTLQLESQFEVADHIGSLAVTPDGILLNLA